MTSPTFSFSADVLLIKAVHRGKLAEVRQRAQVHLDARTSKQSRCNFAYAVLVALFCERETMARWLLKQQVATQRDLDNMFMLAHAWARHELRRMAISPKMVKVLAEYGLKAPELPFGMG